MESSIGQGASVVVRVLEPEGECTVDCVLYTVRWIEKGKIGLEASEISAIEQRRLQDWLTSLGHGQKPVMPSTNPCITIEQPITSMAGAAAVLWQLVFTGSPVTSVSNGGLHFLQRSK
jgi:hypothetical protein